MTDDLLPDPTISDEQLEWLFQPHTVGELLCRLIGIEEFEGRMYAALSSNAPDAMPWRFRGPPFREVQAIVIKEKIYQEELRRRRVAS